MILCTTRVLKVDLETLFRVEDEFHQLEAGPGRSSESHNRHRGQFIVYPPLIFYYYISWYFTISQ